MGTRFCKQLQEAGREAEPELPGDVRVVLRHYDPFCKKRKIKTDPDQYDPTVPLTTTREDIFDGVAEKSPLSILGIDTNAHSLRAWSDFWAKIDAINHVHLRRVQTTSRLVLAIYVGSLFLLAGLLPWMFPSYSDWCWGSDAVGDVRHFDLILFACLLLSTAVGMCYQERYFTRDLDAELTRLCQEASSAWLQPYEAYYGRHIEYNGSLRLVRYIRFRRKNCASLP